MSISLLPPPLQAQRLLDGYALLGSEVLLVGAVAQRAQVLHELRVALDPYHQAVGGAARVDVGEELYGEVAFGDVASHIWLSGCFVYATKLLISGDIGKRGVHFIPSFSHALHRLQRSAS